MRCPRHGAAALQVAPGRAEGCLHWPPECFAEPEVVASRGGSEEVASLELRLEGRVGGPSHHHRTAAAAAQRQQKPRLRPPVCTAVRVLHVAESHGHRHPCDCHKRNDTPVRGIPGLHRQARPEAGGRTRPRCGALVSGKQLTGPCPAVPQVGLGLGPQGRPSPRAGGPGGGGSPSNQITYFLLRQSRPSKSRHPNTTR